MANYVTQCLGQGERFEQTLTNQSSVLSIRKWSICLQNLMWRCCGQEASLYKSYTCIEPLTACCWWPWSTLASTIFNIGKLLHTWNFEFRPCHIPPSVDFISIYDQKKMVGFGRLTLRRIIRPLEFETHSMRFITFSCFFVLYCPGEISRFRCYCIYCISSVSH